MARFLVSKRSGVIEWKSRMYKVNEKYYQGFKLTLDWKFQQKSFRGKTTAAIELKQRGTGRCSVCFVLQTMCLSSL